MSDAPKPYFIQLTDINITPHIIIGVDIVCREEEYPLFDLITLDIWYNDLFVNVVTPNDLRLANRGLSDEAKQTFISFYHSLEMYEHCKVLHELTNNKQSYEE